MDPNTSLNNSSVVAGVQQDDAHPVEQSVADMVIKTMAMTNTDETLVTQKLSMPDPTSFMISNSQSDIAAFLERPIKLVDFTWPVGGSISTDFDPFDNFINNEAIQRKLAGYQFVRFKLHVSILVNGTQFHYGKAIAAWKPYIQGGFQGSGSTAEAILCQLSQKMHSYIDPSHNTPVEMCIPFFYHQDYIDRFLYFPLGEVQIRTMNVLSIANPSASPTIDGVIFAYATDVQLAGPTAHLLPSSGEELPNSTAKRIGKAFSNLGIIAEQKVNQLSSAADMATKLGLLAATFSGFSKPTNVTDAVYNKLQPIPNLTNTSGMDTSSKLTFDPKQSTTVDSRVAGLDGTDEMSLNTVLGRESYLGTILWFSANTPGDLLGTLFNGPTHTIVETTGPSSTLMQFTSISFGSLPFNYWSGSIIYRLQIVCSPWHTGRLRITYEPHNTGLDSSSFNSNYLQIVDLDGNRDYEIVVSWQNAKPYLVIRDIRDPTFFFNSAELGYDPAFFNGKLFISVMNKLVSPDESTPAFINVFVKAGPDFELLDPRSDFNSGRIGFGDLEVEETVEELTLGAPGGNEEEEENIIPTPANTPALVPSSAKDAMIQVLPEQGPVSININGPTHEGMLDIKAQIFSGERITSFRDLIKRFTQSTPIVSADYTQENDRFYWVTVTRSILSFCHGTMGQYYYGQSGVEGNPSPTPFIQYLTEAYAGFRGSVRHKFIPMTNADRPAYFRIERTHVVPDPDPQNWDQVSESNPGENAFSLLSSISQNTMFGGAYVTDQTNQPGVEVEFPYYNAYRFMFTKSGQGPLGLSFDGSGGMFYKITAVAQHENRNNGGITRRLMVDHYVAAGDDYNLLWYQGAPAFFFNTP